LNIIAGERNIVKITDFGFAQMLNKEVKLELSQSESKFDIFILNRSEILTTRDLVKAVAKLRVKRFASSIIHYGFKKCKIVQRLKLCHNILPRSERNY